MPLAATLTRPATAQESAPRGASWPTTNPEDQGLPADLADQIDARVAAETPLLSALRGGQLVVERHYNGFRAEETFAAWSVAKSITT
ncbi:MAG: hypothetical protein M3490_09510, partial [Chloroflexota bacterium]|nr:hypothetical protein [Chloroflexota bacterium]